MAKLDKSTKHVMIGGTIVGVSDILYEVGYKYAGFPNIATYGLGSGGFRLPNLDDCLIDLGIPLISYLATGMSDYTKGALAFGIPMFLLNTWRMTQAEMEAGPGVITSGLSAQANGRTMPKTLGTQTGTTTMVGSQPMGNKQNGLKRQIPSIAKAPAADQHLLV